MALTATGPRARRFTVAVGAEEVALFNAWADAARRAQDLPHLRELASSAAEVRRLLTGVVGADEARRALQLGSSKNVADTIRAIAFNQVLRKVLLERGGTALTDRLRRQQALWTPDNSLAGSTPAGTAPIGQPLVVTPWVFGGAPTTAPDLRVRHTLGRLVAGYFRDPSRRFDPDQVRAGTRFRGAAPPVLSVEEGAARLAAVGWGERMAATRAWRDHQLRDLPQTRGRLEAVLEKVQWLKARIGEALDRILPHRTPIDNGPLVGAISAYQRERGRWVTAQGLSGAEEAEYLLERRHWHRLRNPGNSMPVSDDELASLGYSTLATTVLGLYDPSGHRAPVQALPEAVLTHILTTNETFRDTEEAAAVRTAAEAYYRFGAPGHGQIDTYNAAVRAYADAMRALLADRRRAQAFLVELSFVNTAQRLLLRDPRFIVEEILTAHRDEIFPLPEGNDALGRKGVDLLIQAGERLREAQESGSRVRISRAAQVHNNLLSVMVTNFGPRLIPYLEEDGRHRMTAALRAGSPIDTTLDGLRRRLFTARRDLAARQQAQLEAVSPAAQELWNDLYDPNAAALYMDVIGDYLLTYARELMGRVLGHSPETAGQFQQPFQRALGRAADAFEKFRQAETDRRQLVGHLADPTVPYTGRILVPRDYNRALERAVAAVLGTSPEWPGMPASIQRRFEQKAGKGREPGLLDIAKQAMVAAGLPVDDLYPPIPLFAAFADNFRPMGRAEAREVGRKNPIQVLGANTAGHLMNILAGHRRGDGTDYADAYLKMWMASMNDRFHDLTVVADPDTVGGLLAFFPAPVVDQDHNAWGGDFNALLAVTEAVGAPLPRIIAKADLTGIPAFGTGVKHLAILVSDRAYREVEVRAARAMALGDIPTDLRMLDGTADAEHKIEARIGPRPVGSFSGITMPVADGLNPFDPSPEGALTIPAGSVPFASIGRGTYIALTAEAITGKSQAMLWPTANGSLATYPKPDLRIRLRPGQIRVVVPNPVFTDALPGVRQIAELGVYRFLYGIGNLQRTEWFLGQTTPENIPPVPQERYTLARFAAQPPR